MILYNYFRSSASYRVRIALHFKNIPFHYQPVHLLQGQQHAEEYLKRNPLAQVPCLDDQGFILTQSLPILLYLENKFPEPALLPKNYQEQCKILEFCEIINCTQPLQNLSTLNFLESEFQADSNKKQQWLNRWLLPSFRSLEQWLEGRSKSYCWGSEFTLADCFLAPQIFTARRFGLELNSFSNILQLENKYAQNLVIQKAHPQNQMDTPKA